jgi:hypothetical protein
VRFVVLMVMHIKTAIVWDVALCSIEEIDISEDLLPPSSGQSIPEDSRLHKLRVFENSEQFDLRDCNFEITIKKLYICNLQILSG